MQSACHLQAVVLVDILMVVGDLQVAADFSIPYLPVVAALQPGQGMR